MITIDDAKFNLKIGQVLYHTHNINADGSPQRWKVNGHAKNWVRRPDRVEVPLKHGLYNYMYLTERHLDEFCINEKEAQHGSNDTQSHED